jgi:hypothetical protein
MRAPPRRAILRRAEEVAGEVRRRFLGRELRSYGVMQKTLGRPEAAPSR